MRSATRALSQYSRKAYKTDGGDDGGGDESLNENDPNDSNLENQDENSEGELKKDDQWENKKYRPLDSDTNREIRPFLDESKVLPESWNQRVSKAGPATPLISARQKIPPNLQSTISEDRSCGSNFDRENRILTAVRPQSSTETEFQLAPEDAVSRSSSPPAEVVMQSLLSQENDLEPNLLYANEDLSLNNALRIIREKLDIRNESLLTIETLREYTSRIKTSVVGPRVQVIHRVLQRDSRKKMYLDVPQWSAGAISSKEALIGNLPVHSVSSYLLKYPEVICIVYRDYDGSHPGVEHSDDDTPDADSHPKHSSEVIEFNNEDLKTTIEAFWNHFNFGIYHRLATAEAFTSSPYLPIFFTRTTLGSFLTTLDDTKRLQFQLLLNYILTQCEAEYKLVDDMIGKGKITHRYIKYLFKPGDIVIQGNNQDSRGYLSRAWPKEVSQKPGSDSKTYDFEVEYWTLDCVFSREESKLTLKLDMKDTSEILIDDLDIRPLARVNSQTQKRLRERGSWFWKFRVQHLVSYQEENEQGLQDSGYGRYMIDMKMFRELHPPEKKQVSSKKVDDLGPDVLKQNDPPDDKFVYLTPSTIKGFNLKRKKWLDLEVDKIRPVTWNKQAFKHLVIKEKTKRLIQALISNQIEAERSTDLITGKGNGLIMLLHGGPGTGKTLTAESVAEIAEKPLYPVTCGDIGTRPEEVEEYLESVLHIGKTWGCVVLLDEADVFLEQRSLEDLHRNALVSVFLRVLEYYDGILVLTSNRVGTFDEAFKSRIQLALHYKNLTEHQRTQIWGNFLSRLEEINEDGIDFVDLKDNIEKLAKHKLNGREIRNVITTARQYARWERQQPNRQHIQLDYKMMKEVIEIAGEFDRYIEKLNGGNTYDQLAEDDGLRLGDDA